MKVKVVKKFIDKRTKALHKVGETLNITEGRMKEILSVGNFVEKIEKDEKK